MYFINFYYANFSSFIFTLIFYFIIHSDFQQFIVFILLHQQSLTHSINSVKLVTYWFYYTFFIYKAIFKILLLIFYELSILYLFAIRIRVLYILPFDPFKNSQLYSYSDQVIHFGLSSSFTYDQICADLNHTLICIFIQLLYFF